MNNFLSFVEKRRIFTSFSELNETSISNDRINFVFNNSKLKRKVVVRELAQSGNGYVYGVGLEEEYIVDERGWINIKNFSEAEIRILIIRVLNLMQGDYIENQEIIRNIKEINKRLCNKIWNVVSSEQTIQGLTPRLILPYINGVARISEQEARVLCTSILNSTSYYYSVETPTDTSYQFTGNYALKARSDLSIYEIDKDKTLDKIVNVEFKAHNPEISYIKKDIEKLIREDVVGNWFHLFKNTDNGTFSSVFNKFIQSINDNKQYVNKTISIVFCFCVVEKKIALQKHFYFTPNTNIDLDEYNRQFFKLNTLDSNSSSYEENGWELIRI